MGLAVALIPRLSTFYVNKRYYTGINNSLHLMVRAWGCEYLPYLPLLLLP